ncbi:MAG TPA: TonB-dependent receptor [Moraxellaceae bacterium]|nr:TonB-dependent receptor [Moraxellaceae bacterium]
MPNGICPQGVLRLIPLLLTSSLAAAADTAEPPFADGGDVPTVLSATRLSQSLFETPAAVTIIDRQMIEQSGVREIPELLRLVPGMVVGYDPGTDAFVSFHGTSADLARRMQVLIDGRSIYQPLLAQVDWIGLPVELPDIERIEVIRGPDSSTWGANSFLAVVNIVTRHPADVERARITYRSGDDGIQDYLARLAQRTGNVDWRLSLAGRSDDGFQYNLRQNRSNYTDSKDIGSGYGRAVWTADGGGTLDVGFGFAAMRAEQQYRPTFFLATPISHRDNGYLSMAWDQDLGDSHHLKLQASQSRFSRFETWYVRLPRVVFSPVLGQLYDQNRACANGVLVGDVSACTPADMPLVVELGTAIATDPLLTRNADWQALLDDQERRTEVDINDTWALSPDLRAVYGLTYNRSQADSRLYLDGPGDNTVWRAFVHAEWRFLPDWVLNAGGNEEVDDASGNYFSPRVAVNWLFQPNQSLRAVYSSAVRTPDILENQADFGYRVSALDPADQKYAGTFYMTGKANGTAPTEKIVSHELGYYARFDPARLTVDLRGFYDNMDLAEHKLAVDGSEGFQIRPTEPMTMQGAELTLDFRPWPSQRFQLNYAYIDVDKALPSNDNTNFVPQHMGSLGWWQDYGNGVQFGNTYYFYDNLRSDKNIFWDRLDNRLAKTWRLAGGHRLTLAGVLQSRLTNVAPEIRSENGSSRYRSWISMDWQY